RLLNGSNAAVVLRHRSVRDLVPARLRRRELFSSLLPRVLRMRQAADPLRALVSIEFENSIDRIPLNGGQFLLASVRPFADKVLTAVNAIEVWHDGAVDPRLDPLTEQRFFVPNQ